MSAAIPVPPHELALVVVLGLLVVERAAELVIDRRNARWLGARGAMWHAPDAFPLILTAQVILIGGTAAEAWFAPWSTTGPWSVFAIAALVLAQLVRYWVIVTLGSRWSMRVVTLPGRPRIATGPYRWFAHPNYAAVMLEAVALPLVFMSWTTLAVAAPLAWVALRRRVRFEEAALEAARPREAALNT